MYFPGRAISLVSFEVKIQPIISELDLVFSVGKCLLQCGRIRRAQSEVNKGKHTFHQHDVINLLLSYTWLFPEH